LRLSRERSKSVPNRRFLGCKSNSVFRETLVSLRVRCAETRSASKCRLSRTNVTQRSHHWSLSDLSVPRSFANASCLAILKVGVAYLGIRQSGNVANLRYCSRRREALHKKFRMTRDAKIQNTNCTILVLYDS
jgi:hypothetical protein